ncbi:hypothetical protein STAL104432_03900 [Streptomyces albus]
MQRRTTNIGSAALAVIVAGVATFHFVDDDAAKVLERAKEAAQGKDVRVGGGATTIRAFLEADLVDTLHVVVNPSIMLGSGARLWVSPSAAVVRGHRQGLPPGPLRAVQGGREGQA